MRIEFATGSACLSLNLGSQVRKALRLLLDAAEYADDLDRDLWDFALMIRELRAVGLSDNDLRWLACKGIVDVAIELTEPGEAVRTFRPCGSAMFSDRACFALSKGAQAFAVASTSESMHVDTPCNGHATANPARPLVAPVVVAGQVPVWDCDRQELRWGGTLIKQFKVPSPNQETILAAFEEEHWPPRIDDPLPPQMDQEPKRTAARHDQHAQSQSKERADPIPRRRQRSGGPLGTGRRPCNPQWKAIEWRRRERFAR